MNKLVYKLSTAVSTAALLTGSVASVAFGTTTVTISGNGSDSDNTSNVSVNTSKSIFQTNTANIQNNIDIDAKTGDNEANDNTGGEVEISTGNANVSSSVSNSANSNVASVGCGDCDNDTEIKISGNGSDSDNTVNFQNNSATDVVQANYANVSNYVDVDAKTGGNDANDNTGGEVSIETGDADVVVDVKNAVNQNVASVGGNGGGDVDVEISGNGSGSDNEANVGINSLTTVFQNNVADISNDIDVDAETGDNDAKDNTGGEVSIETGDANVEVDVENKANFNGLDLSGCDCEMDLDVKVAGNGSDSDNKANVQLNSVLAAIQDNVFDCDGENELWSLSDSNDDKDSCNDVDVDSKTGGNDANDNTVGDDEDPVVETGDAGADVDVSTEANSNVLGEMDGFNLPELPDMDDLNGWMLLFFMGKSSN